MKEYIINKIPIKAKDFKQAIFIYNNDLTYKDIKVLTGEYKPTQKDKILMALEEQHNNLNSTLLTPFQFNYTYNWNDPKEVPVEDEDLYIPQPNNKPKKPEKTKTQKKIISHFYKYKRLSKYEGLIGPTPIRAGTTFIGVEIELEKVYINNIPHNTWKMVEDGSLKVAGQEFVTVPIQFRYLEIELQRLFGGLISYEASTRCSVHIHINVRDFTLEELKTFICLYMVFERSLYAFSGNRLNNNFCVPLSYHPTTVKNFIQHLNDKHITENWYKYFGFNLSPIFGGESTCLGTIEFRHMEGTTDISRILSWINLIVSLKITAKKMPYSELLMHIETMNTTSGYYWLAEQVFKDFKQLITTQPTFKEDVEHCITIAKEILFTDNTKKAEEEEITFTRKETQQCAA